MRCALFIKMLVTKPCIRRVWILTSPSGARCAFTLAVHGSSNKVSQTIFCGCDFTSWNLSSTQIKFTKKCYEQVASEQSNTNFTHPITYKSGTPIYALSVEFKPKKVFKSSPGNLVATFQVATNTVKSSIIFSYSEVSLFPTSSC